MKKILGLAVFAIVCLAFSSCAVSTKVPAYPDGDSKSKVVFGNMETYADDNYVTVRISVYNYTQHDYQMVIGCVWYNKAGQRLVEGKEAFNIKSGTKKNFELSELYQGDSSLVLDVECKTFSVQALK